MTTNVKELLDSLSEYIKGLEGFAFVHGWKCPKNMIDSWTRLRTAVENLLLHNAAGDLELKETVASDEAWRKVAAKFKRERDDLKRDAGTLNAIIHDLKERLKSCEDSFEPVAEDGMVLREENADLKRRLEEETRTDIADDAPEPSTEVMEHSRRRFWQGTAGILKRELDDLKQRLEEVTADRDQLVRERHVERCICGHKGDYGERTEDLRCLALRGE